MSYKSRSRVVVITVAVVACVAAVAKPRIPATDTANISHALNRLTWGPAPGDAQRVVQIGLRKWIDEQLHPERIAENPLLLSRLEPLDTLRMSTAEMIQHYPPRQVVRAMASGRVPLPADPESRALAQREIARFRQKQAEKKTDDQNLQKADIKASSFDMLSDGEGDRPRLRDILTPEQASALRTGTPDQRLQAFETLQVTLQDRVIEALPKGAARELAAAAPLELERRIELRLDPEQVIATDLQQAKLLRAIYTNRQLEDVLTDFWFNHFNIFLDKGADRFLTTAYERDAIRPHVLGHFYDLLLATAQSPAMLFYLDNWQSADPNSAARIAAERQRRREDRQEMRRMRTMAGGALGPYRVRRPVSAPPNSPQGKRRSRGLNENYGRELMELHSLGVDGGYTQKDVTEVARCFTGWTIRYLDEKPQFFFDERLHDPGEKTVLHRRISAGGGISDGLTVLKMLAASHATAHHISYQLAQRFVADTPPESLVQRMTATFLGSDGNLRKVTETMLDSSEFWDARYSRAKVKSPLEMVVSSVRALGVNVSNPSRLAQVIAQMGEPLYRQQPPTGYANTGDGWVSSTGLLSRLNFALALTSDRTAGAHVDLSMFAPGEADASSVTSALYAALLDGKVSEQTRGTIEKALASSSAATQPPQASGNPAPISPAQVQMLAGLILGSPEFQRR